MLSTGLVDRSSAHRQTDRPTHIEQKHYLHHSLRVLDEDNNNNNNNNNESCKAPSGLTFRGANHNNFTERLKVTQFEQSRSRHVECY